MSDIANMDTSEIYLPEETRLINKSLSLRESMVDELFKDGTPKDSRKIRVVNEVLNSMDNLVLGKVDRRLKNNENKNNENTLELVKEVLLKVEEEQSKIKITDIPEIVELSPDEIIPGEDKIDYEELDLKDFTE